MDFTLSLIVVDLNAVSSFYSKVTTAPQNFPITATEYLRPLPTSRTSSLLCVLPLSNIFPNESGSRILRSPPKCTVESSYSTCHIWPETNILHLTLSIWSIIGNFIKSIRQIYVSTIVVRRVIYSANFISSPV